MTCDRLLDTVKHMIVSTSQIVFEQTARQRTFVHPVLGKEAREPVQLCFVILSRIVLRRENVVVQLGMGDLMDEGSDSLRLAHALADSNALLALPEYAVAVRVHSLKADRDGRSALQSFQKGFILLHIPLDRRRQLRQRFTFGLRYVEDRGDAEARDGDFFLLRDGLAVFVQHRRFGVGIKLDLFHGLFGDGRGDDLDALFAALDVPLEVIAPLVEAGDARGVRLLHKDQHGVVEGIPVEAAHGLQILLVFAAGEHIPDTVLDAVRDLLQPLTGAFFRLVLRFLRDRDFLLDGFPGQMPVELLLLIRIRCIRPGLG